MARSRLPRLNLKAKLLLLLGGLTLVSILTVGVLSVTSIIQASRTAQDVGGRTLNAQIKESMLDLIESSVEKTDLELDRVGQDVLLLKDFAEQIYNHPENFPGSAYWRLENHMLTGSKGQHYSRPEDTSEFFIPNFVEIDRELIAEMEQMALLDLVVVPVHESDPNTALIWVIMESEVSWNYPNHSVWKILRPDFVPTVEFEYASAAPENNPEKTVIWSDVYDDEAGLGLMVSALAPLFLASDAFVGVIGIDVTLAQLTARFEEAGPIAGGYWLLVNQEGKALAMPPGAYVDILGREREEEEFGTDLTANVTGFSPILAEMMAGGTGFTTIDFDGDEHFVTYAPMSNTGWSLAYIVESESLTKVVTDLQAELDRSTTALIWQRLVPAGLLILVIALGIGFWYMGRLTSPIEALSVAAKNLGAGNWDQELPPAGEDEIGVLSKAFGSMAVELRGMMEGLEEKVVERTKELSTANERMKKSEAQNRTVIENAPVGMILFTDEGIIRDCNDHFVKLMGSSRDRLLGFNTLKDASDPGVRQGLQRALNGKWADFEGPYTSTTGGKAIDLRIIYNPVSATELPTEVIATLEDITVRKAAEKALAERTKELRQANQTLERLAEKLSKYLSPQIYQSIFSGETDVVLSTTRKKLTIFFSDLKDFTATTENLQPEDLTFILNDYFTEMSAIALEHGATIDKFIGDAILAFFGDPETKGVKEDAAACVRMAIAMQRRMKDLREKWEHLGYEKPLHMRIGINTGYCNVGNFGSDDRMDYTIIGGEVNLAARLESKAEPDGILLAYETYVNVQDIVEAEEQPPMQVKGIRREVRPFKVVGLFEELAEGIRYVHRKIPGLTISIDLNKLSHDEARQALDEAIHALGDGE